MPEKMSTKANDETVAPLSWPFSHDSASTHSRDIVSKSPQHGHAKEERGSERMPSRAVISNMPEVPLNFHLPVRKEPYSHDLPDLNAVHGSTFDRAAVSLDQIRRSTKVARGRNSKELTRTTAIQLRCGAHKPQSGLSGWLKRHQGVKQRLDKGDIKKPSAITYKGKTIGSPLPASVLDVLPPASRFGKQFEHHSSTNTAFKSPQTPLNSDYNVNGTHLFTIPQQNYIPPQRSVSPSLPLTRIPLAATSRPVTTNPFAHVYGNRAVVRTGPTFSPIDYEVAGSLINRLSALDGSQTGYGTTLQTPRRNPLRNSDKASNAKEQPPASGEDTFVQKVPMDRKWDALPALPSEEGAPPPPPNPDFADDTGGAEDGMFDTEAVLSSLRPERLSLYHINTTGRPSKDLARDDHEPGPPTPYPDYSTPFKWDRLANDDSCKRSDNCSDRTRGWEVQSRATDELGIDSLLAQREQHPRSKQKRPLPEQRRQDNIRDNHKPSNGLPEEAFSVNGLSNEGAPNPESIFYTRLITIMQKYHDQQKMIQRAFEAGQMSEEYLRQDKWRHRTALDRNITAAADMSTSEVRCYPYT